MLGSLNRRIFERAASETHVHRIMIFRWIQLVDGRRYRVRSFLTVPQWRPHGATSSRPREARTIPSQKRERRSKRRADDLSMQGSRQSRRPVFDQGENAHFVPVRRGYRLARRCPVPLGPAPAPERGRSTPLRNCRCGAWARRRAQMRGASTRDTRGWRAF